MRSRQSMHENFRRAAVRTRKFVANGIGVAATCALIACEEVAIDAEVQGEAITNESGGSVQIAVTLAVRPRGAVTVRAVSSDETEATVSGPLRFHRNNWDVPQMITVMGVNDDIDDGDAAYDVLLYAGPGRSERHAELVDVIAFVNEDDDVADFRGIGDLPGGEVASFAADVSANGAVVVGWSSGPEGDEAVRWTEEGDLEGLGGPQSQAHAVSPDGTLITGSIAEPSHHGGRAAVLWREGQPYEILVGPTVGGRLYLWVVDGGAVLDDGRVFGTCVQTGAYGEPIACVYNAPGDVTTVRGSRIFVADAEGDYAGTQISERHAPLFSHAMYNGTQLPYPPETACAIPSGCLAEARDFSADNSVIVGTALLPGAGEPLDSPLYETAFVYTTAEGTVRLPDLAGGEEAAGAYAISADGSVIAGYGTDESGQQAVVWLDGVPYLLEDLFEAAGGDVPDGWMLHDVRATSAEGLTLVGNATNPEGYPEGFRLILPVAPEPVALQ